ncbi:hypothetical protein KOI35_25550 [Actinoplanes bogorensis]|uniref:RNA polymerase sigma factor 70 region 4 type 2 domain-containing protein n=2 Tax=Paractinoplanes bogorensis TaxID=1610840 RepID=A0ABS5YTU5_9ACTN|nr:hypothetical protein [Actinoplanes bogorensis]
MLRHLPPPRREILVATYFHGRTTSEAARLLGLTRDEARRRLYQAMRDLSEMVGHEETAAGWRRARRHPATTH